MFAERLDDEVILVDQEDAWRLFTDFDKWDKVNLILHQGAISSTTEKDLQKLWHYNVAFSCALLNKAIEYQIPIKYASSASVYGNQSIHQKAKTYNPLNQYAISKLQVDYTVLDNIDKFSLFKGLDTSTSMEKKTRVIKPVPSANSPKMLERLVN